MKKGILIIGLFLLLGSCNVTRYQLEVTTYEIRSSKRFEVAAMPGVEIINDTVVNVTGDSNIVRFSNYCGCKPGIERRGVASFKFSIKN